MTVESDVQTGAHAAPEAPVAPAPAGNPALLGLITFLPSGVTLGLWFLGYLDTAALPGGMIPIVSLSAGLFLMISAVWAARLAANTVAAIFGVFSAFWLSFGALLTGLTSGWWGVADAAAVANVQRTYLLSFTLVFILLTLATLRLPIAFTAGFVFVDITFALAFLGVSTGNAGLFPIAGITTLIFCAIFAYILFDGFAQDLGGKAMPLGNALVK
ncbi:GPR1/FUN34/YaaH family transporter [Pseudonocardia sp. WMMC193]|uniref:GPR1/FUN34/YaaH family transporter n=1 Tax=Pseudonocardia sp. WMMC193 TaxID=2911965 RepID=UPI001F022C68|nr:GPR1/FUN34/YaaH family transporter [Pseudonocardia sp. WMMC193]MCF7553215.1 GPR1/FUN34/YaaH family transporter [Pseudonocardia sp. WMMC193]